MDIIAVDTITTDVPYIMTVRAIIPVAMLILMTTDRNTEVKDIAVHRVSTMLRKTNEPALQGSISSKPVIRLSPLIRTATGRRLSGYGKAIPKEAGNPQPKGNRTREEAGLRQQRLQAEHNRIITDKIPAR
jgi:hypothetical protein